MTGRPPDVDAWIGLAKAIKAARKQAASIYNASLVGDFLLRAENEAERKVGLLLAQEALGD